MLEVATFDAKNRLSELLDKVERGEEVVITRRGKAVARLVRVIPERNRKKAQEALDRIIERSKGTSLGGLKIKDLINEGRP